MTPQFFHGQWKDGETTGEVFGKKDQDSPVSRLFLVCVFDAQWEY